MNVAILTCTTPNRKWLYDITNPTKVEYCRKFGYTYIFDENFYPDKARHPYWNKIKFVSEHLKDFDYVVWMDDDAGFIKFDNDLEDFLECDFGYCEDLNGFNCGVFVVKNTEENRNIFEFIWDKMYQNFKDHKFPEQDALKEIYQNKLSDFSTKFEGSLYNAYDKRIITSKNQRTEDTIILHIASGSAFKEANKVLIRDLFIPK